MIHTSVRRSFIHPLTGGVTPGRGRSFIRRIPCSPPRRLAALLLVTISLAAAGHAAAQGAVFVVRHAERADAGMAASMMDGDPPLSARGQARAKALAAMLRDAEIRAVYTTDLKRTQQTGAPLATMAGATLTALPAADVPGLLEKVRAEAGNVLIVGHSNTIPKILAALGVTGSPEIAENEYDNLFIVVPDSRVRVLRLRYE